MSWRLALTCGFRLNYFHLFLSSLVDLWRLCNCSNLLLNFIWILGCGSWINCQTFQNLICHFQYLSTVAQRCWSQLFCGWTLPASFLYLPMLLTIFWIFLRSFLRSGLDRAFCLSCHHCLSYHANLTILYTCLYCCDRAFARQSTFVHLISGGFVSRTTFVRANFEIKRLFYFICRGRRYRMVCTAQWILGLHLLHLALLWRLVDWRYVVQLERLLLLLRHVHVVAYHTLLWLGFNGTRPNSRLVSSINCGRSSFISSLFLEFLKGILVGCWLVNQHSNSEVGILASSCLSFFWIFLQQSYLHELPTFSASLSFVFDQFLGCCWFVGNMRNWNKRLLACIVRAVVFACLWLTRYLTDNRFIL